MDLRERKPNEGERERSNESYVQHTVTFSCWEAGRSTIFLYSHVSIFFGRSFLAFLGMTSESTRMDSQHCHPLLPMDQSIIFIYIDLSKLYHPKCFFVCLLLFLFMSLNVCSPPPPPIDSPFSFFPLIQFGVTSQLEISQSFYSKMVWNIPAG